MIFALTGKAVGTVQVAGVGHMKAQCLDDAGGFLFQRSGHRLKGIRCKELAGILQILNLSVALGNIFFGNIAAAGIFIFHGRKDILTALFFKQGDDIIGDFVHRMDRA